MGELSLKWCRGYRVLIRYREIFLLILQAMKSFKKMRLVNHGSFKLPISQQGTFARQGS